MHWLYKIQKKSFPIYSWYRKNKAMKIDKIKTIDVIKGKRIVPEGLKEKRKEYNDVRKSIKKVLADGPKTIPQIANETGIPSQVITYTLMTCRRYDEIETGELDEMDEYFTYQLKKK